MNLAQYTDSDGSKMYDTLKIMEGVGNLDNEIKKINKENILMKHITQRRLVFVLLLKG